MRRLLSLALAFLFCALTVAQITRPLKLSHTTEAATHQHKLMRHIVAEVADKAVDIAAASSRLTHSMPVVERQRDHAAPITSDEADATEWTSEYKFHRRNPPRTPEDHS